MAPLEWVKKVCWYPGRLIPCWTKVPDPSVGSGTICTKLRPTVASKISIVSCKELLSCSASNNAIWQRRKS